MDRRPLAVCLCLALLPLTTGAAEVYRYLDRNGTLVIDRQGVPPEYAGKGYDVLNEQGRLVRQVPPTPPAEELQRQAQARQQAAADAQALKLYSSVADVERAKARKLAELDGILQSKQVNLQVARQTQEQLMQQAAAQQRSGQALDAEIQARLDAATTEQARLSAEVIRYTTLRDATAASFDADRARMQRLQGGTP